MTGQVAVVAALTIGLTAGYWIGARGTRRVRDAASALATAVRITELTARIPDRRRRAREVMTLASNALIRTVPARPWDSAREPVGTLYQGWYPVRRPALRNLPTRSDVPGWDHRDQQDTRHALPGAAAA